MPVTYTCLHCGKEATCPPRTIKRGGGKYCSYSCRALATSVMQKGENHFRWNNGTTYRNGYRYVRNTSHPRAGKDNLVPEHWIVIEKKIGRYLEPHEQVHHLNGIRDDNRPENLVVVATSMHNTLYHTAGKWLTCDACGKEYWRTPSQLRKNKSGITACSHSCTATLRHKAGWYSES